MKYCLVLFFIKIVAAIKERLVSSDVSLSNFLLLTLLHINKANINIETELM